MKQVILSCPTLKKEILHLIEELNLDTPVYFLPKRLHSNPQELAEYLQNTIDSFANVDRILICVSVTFVLWYGMFRNREEMEYLVNLLKSKFVK
mgnify:CR=1 FL=1